MGLTPAHAEGGGGGGPPAGAPWEGLDRAHGRRPVPGDTSGGGTVIGGWFTQVILGTGCDTQFDEGR